MAENENLSEEDLKAQRDADEYFRENYPDMDETQNIYAHIPFQNTTSEKKDESAPASVVGTVAGLGAAASYKGVGTKLLKPGEGVFKPANVQPKAPSVAPSYETRVEPEFHLENESPLSHADPYDSRVDEVMKSLRGEGEATGKQMRQGHNMEAQREKWALEHNLKQHPSATRVIADFGPQYPTESGLVVSEKEGRHLEEERIRRLAQDRIAQEQAEQAAEQAKAEKKLAEENAKAQAELAQRKAEEKAATTGKVLGVGKGIAKVGLGALGGALSGKDFWDAYHEYKKHGWSDEAISKAIQGTGGVFMMVPTPWTEAGGAALVGAGMAYPSVAKHFHK